MDDNTLKLLLAFLAALQVISLAVISSRQARTHQQLHQVHDLVNGLAHEKDQAVKEAAQLQGELRGRDYVVPPRP